MQTAVFWAHLHIMQWRWVTVIYFKFELEPYVGSERAYSGTGARRKRRLRSPESAVGVVNGNLVDDEPFPR